MIKGLMGCTEHGCGCDQRVNGMYGILDVDVVKGIMGCTEHCQTVSHGVQNRVPRMCGGYTQWCASNRILPPTWLDCAECYGEVVQGCQWVGSCR